MTNAERLEALQAQYGSFHMESGHVLVDTGADFITVKRHPDIYEALYDLSDDKYPTAKGLAIVTTGWAAPLNANGEVDGAPSQHAERRRVRLSAYVSCQGMTSLVAFEDEDGFTIDEGNATGSLAEALLDTWASISR